MDVSPVVVVYPRVVVDDVVPVVVVPVYDGAIFARREGPGWLEGCGEFESINMVNSNRSADSSVSYPPPHPASPIDLAHPKRKFIEHGTRTGRTAGGGCGCELCIEIDSEGGVWSWPLPFKGGTPTSLVRREAGFEAEM
jgi:hypothetical protein